MKVLLVHNYYQHAGGEDQAFAAEAALLERKGHEVYQYVVHNDDLHQRSSATMAVDAVWNRAAYADIRKVVTTERPDVVHFHNTFPIVSPASYVAARRSGAAVVQTLHNYRLICPSAILFRDGHPCEDCVSRRLRWPGVIHRCYRSSLPASGVIATMLAFHEARGTWQRDVDAYIALTDFARGKFVEGGLPARRVFVKPNILLDDPGMGTGDGGYALFVGRLVPEKGIRTLLEAWSTNAPGLPLRVVGAGPMESELAAVTAVGGRIEWYGSRPHSNVLELMRRASVLVMPSEWYEGLPMTIVEALATGLPVVASSIGAMTSLVSEGRTGCLVPPGDGGRLADAVRRIVQDENARLRMRRSARESYESQFAPDRNHEVLLSIYREALKTRAAQ